MADGIDAFLYFGRALKGGKPQQIDGETTDTIEREAVDGYGKSMSIQTYNIGFKLDASLTEEHVNQSDDKQEHDPEITQITVTKLVDAASPILLSALWFGTQYRNAWISQRKAGGQKSRSGDYFWQIELREVSIIDLTWSADNGGQTMESITLHAAKGAYVQYFKQKHTGELEQSPINFEAAIHSKSNKNDKKNGDQRNGGATKLDTSQTRSVVNDVIQQLKRNNPHLNIRG
jgi:type VI protein secretion system component Hcp